jgi:hypothetical protein
MVSLFFSSFVSQHFKDFNKSLIVHGKWTFGTRAESLFNPPFSIYKWVNTPYYKRCKKWPVCCVVVKGDQHRLLVLLLSEFTTMLKGIKTSNEFRNFESQFGLIDYLEEQMSGCYILIDLLTSC